MSHKLFLFTSCFLSLWLCQCTEQNGTDASTKSVTDLAVGGSEVNLTCSPASAKEGERALAASLIKDRTLFLGESAKDLEGRVKAPAQDAIATLPKAVLNYFIKQKGIIVVTDKTAKYCESAAAVKNADGCYRRVPASAVESLLADESGSKSKLKSLSSDDLPTLLILVRPQATYIGHNLTRLFSYLVAEDFAQVNPSQKFALSKRQLARAFVRDLSKSYLFASDEKRAILGGTLSDQLQPVLKAGDELTDHPEILNSNDWLQLENKAFAEIMHDYYCSVGKKYDATYAAGMNKKPLSEIDFSKLQDSRLFLKDFFSESREVFETLAKPLSVESDTSLALADTGSILALADTGSSSITELCSLYPEAPACKSDTKPDGSTATSTDSSVLSDVCSLYPWASGCDGKPDTTAAVAKPADKTSLESILGVLLDKISSPLGGGSSSPLSASGLGSGTGSPSGGPLGSGPGGSPSSPGPLSPLGVLSPILSKVGTCGGHLTSTASPVAKG